MPDTSPRRRSSRTTQLNQSSNSSSVSSSRHPLPTDAGKTPTSDLNNKSMGSPTSDTSEAEQEPDVRTRQTRRQKREQDTHLDPKASVELGNEDADADAEEDGGDDITRCICRREHYPGPPVPLGGSGRSFDALDEEAGGLFISCDNCKVWQHGGCVGIMDQASTPENYYCEQCRSDLHRVMQSAKGYKYSQYLPVMDGTERSSSRTKSMTKDAESRSSRERENRSGSQKNLMPNEKRRSTMNSRAAYDEEEMIRLAVEESKGNGTHAGSGSLKGRIKRARNDSEESDHDLKRRKTGSGSATPSDPNVQSHEPGSDEDKPKNTSKTGHNGDRARGTHTRTLSEKDVRRRDRERELERAEAAGRRKGRAERRRGDDPQPVEEPPKVRPAPRAAATAQKSSRSQTSAKQAAPAATGTSTIVSHKKGAKPAARRGKVGRNQYTKERDAIADARAEAARPSKSRDGEDGDGKDTATLLPNGSKPSKPRHMNPNRVSLNELRKRVAGILEFISKTQVELAGDKTPPEAKTPTIPANASKSAVRPRLSRVASVNSASKLSNEISRHADDQNDEATPKVRQETVADGVFKGMSSLQMMDALSRDIIHWQQQHGKWGEK